MKNVNVKELELYKMTESEKQKWKEIQQAVFLYCNTLQIPEFMFQRIETITSGGMYYGNHVAGYCEGKGYFYLEYGDRGEIFLKCLSHNVDDICFCLMKQITRETGQKIELRERKKECKDSRKIWFEYMLNALLQIFDEERMAPVIVEYTDYMNFRLTEPRWAYDKTQRQFVEITGYKE